MALSRRLLLLASLASAPVLVGCDDGKPIVLEAKEFASPDGKWVAVLEEVDNGLGFGQGAIFQEVHILRPGDKAQSHGDRSSSNVFYAESIYDAGTGVSVRWQSNERLQISFDRRQHPGKLVTAFFGITIEARPSAVASQ